MQTETLRPAATPSALAARYFDGKTSRLYHVSLSVVDGKVVVDGELRRSTPLQQMRVSERSSHAARKVTFPDGAYLEVSDKAAFLELLHATGYRDSWTVRMQQSWRGALLALGGAILVLLLGYVFILPQASDRLARALPERLERQLGQGMLELLDQHVFQPSALSAVRQQQLTGRFRLLSLPDDQISSHRIVFRKSKIGPNAFALPSGDIVMTDEMVRLLPDDDALMGVLAHELGHLHERHLSRRVIQGSVVAAATTLLFGDVSALISAAPTLMLDSKYSRDIENEADSYAIAVLQKNGIALEHLVRVFTELEQLGGGVAPYVSSHPSGAERIARIRAAEQR
ncbi:M48 family metallopeptidase [Janthinobacterium agaricidamnosum]|uniref:Peptidase M48 family protein n=1 Tax=Janthinobacterium agaricidamnosum NBRC 102515 = DSM 9628 TaxID=1349767 RepID=W0V170_9BURK|nr:M48 family metallopeptidase [Janthinobacterium agaricidamnosum]CDG81017.1 peptidase M48 family protein [Janthinobacterium agaricidamnosum NBRC 102515 = DSM 9628]